MLLTLVLIVISMPVCSLSFTRLDMFRLGYILTHRFGYEFVYIDLFLANVSILYPLKTPGNHRLAVFSGGLKWEQWPKTT